MSLSDHLAQTTGQLMMARDPVAKAMGFKLIEISPGQSQVEMRVREDMVNALGLCSGGAIFALAESCFLLACNSHNQRAVSQSASIHHIHPATAGDRLIATGVEINRTPRSGLYRVEVRAESGVLTAEFQGQARFVRGTWVQAFAP